MTTAGDYGFTWTYFPQQYYWPSPYPCPGCGRPGTCPCCGKPMDYGVNPYPRIIPFQETTTTDVISIGDDPSALVSN